MPTRYPGVERRPDGTVAIRWTVRSGGRRVNRKASLPPETTLQEAAAIRAKRLAETASSVRSSETDRRLQFRAMTLGEYAAQWLESRGKSFKAATTLANWGDALVHHILPVLGHVQIGQLRPADLRDWVAYAERATFIPHTARPKKVTQADGSVVVVEPTARPYARESIASWWSKLRQLVRDAAADADITDPTLRARPPKCTGRATVRERRTLSFDELSALLDAVPRAWHAEVFTDAMLGLRPGELYALEWARDVDLERRVFHVRWAHVRGTLSTTKGEPRDVPLGERLTALLRQHRQTMLREQRPGVESGLVFPASEKSPKRGWYRMSTSLAKVLERASRSVGLPIRVTPQVLRRTWNSLQVESGVDRLILRSIVGHVDEEMTELYYHARDPVRLAAVENFEARVVSPGGVPLGTPPAPETKKPRKSGA